MRRERVHLCYSRHKGYYRGPHTASASDKVTVFKRILDQLLSRHVYDVIVMLQDSTELCFNPLFNDIGRILTVYFVHSAVYQIFKVFS